MNTILAAPRRHAYKHLSQLSRRRCVSTLPNNPHIVRRSTHPTLTTRCPAKLTSQSQHVFPHPQSPNSRLLSLLPTDPPTPDLAIGTTSTMPPTPDSVAENPHFMQVLQDVVAQHATQDPAVQAQAAAFASSAGASLGSGGAFFSNPAAPSDKRRRRPRTAASAASATGGGGGAGGGGAGGASAQGGMGGGGVGGFVHVSDTRNPPDWGRIAWPEDIFGSVQVDGAGAFVGAQGGYQRSGTYRVCTNEGVLGLTDFMRAKVVQRLSELEAMVKSKQ